ncbi:MAG: ABC transporter permease, partial [Verrucomicrobiales bacterium]|nr:ABC transporter permease [Verrucomicrobiales bacterium]
MSEIRRALRQWVKEPAFTALAVLTLALGIGASTAIFSVVYGVLIRPYPYAKPGEIWTPGLRTASSDQRMRPYRQQEFESMSQVSAFADVMATSPEDMLLTGTFSPETLRTVRISPNAAAFLGVPPVMGRTLGPADVRADGEAEPVVLLSYSLWMRLFDGRAEALGKTLRLNDEEYTVVGVMPPRFGWWTSDGLWVPMGRDLANRRSVFPIVRLKPGVAAKAAEEQFHALQTQWARDHPAGFPKESFDTTLTNYLEMTVARGEMARSLTLLFGAVGVLLLIACANVANLQLARGSTRFREMAVRLALGAPRRRLVRQLLSESVLLALAGGGLGLILAYGITRWIVILMPSFYVPGEARIEINTFVLLFSLLLSTLTGVVFGLVPALQASKPNLDEALKGEARGSSTSKGGRFRSGLVVVEVALSVILLVCAGLTIRGFLALRQVDLGFHPGQVMVLQVPLATKTYGTIETRNRFSKELEERVRHLPGVEAVSVGNGGLPFGGGPSTYAIDHRPAQDSQKILLQLAGAEYLKVLRIPLLRGRMFTDREVGEAKPVAVINEAAARLWPVGEDPVGKSLRLDALDPKGPGPAVVADPRTPDVMVIGVVGDTRNDGLRSPTQPAAILPYTLLAPPGRSLALRTSMDPALVTAAVRAQVRQMDPAQPLRGPRTLEESVNDQSVQLRFTMVLFSLFGAFGLALATAGIYGVLAFLVSRRRREIGVRMALGADRFEVQRLFLRSGGRLLAMGLVLGLLGAVLVGRVLVHAMDLFRVAPADPVAILGVIGLLALVGFAACLIPARRATRVDP